MEPSSAPRGRAFRAAFPATLPVLTGYLCLGFAFGVLLRTKGYGPPWAALMSLTIFGGSIQFLACTLLVSAFDPLQAFALSFLVDARHIFYGLSVLEKYKGTGKLRPFLIAMLTDETFSLVSTLEPPEGAEPRYFYFWISILDYAYWQAGSLLGNLLGGVLPFDSTGLDFVLTALFVVLFLEQWKKRENRPAGVIGVLCAAAALAAVGGGNMVVAAMVLILAVLAGGRKKLCA